MNEQIADTIKFEWIKTPEQKQRLVEFASTFEHKVAALDKHPHCFIKRHGMVVGYAQMYMGPTVFSSWHTNPNICHPRDVMEGMKAFAGWGKLQHGGGFVGVPTDTKSFLPHVMNKLGFLRSGIELYEIWAD